MIGKADAAPPANESLSEAVARLEQTGISRMDAMKQVARERGVSKRDVYSAVESGKR